MRQCAKLVVTILLLAFSGSAAQADTGRIAWVVGNSSYRDAPRLSYAVDRAKEVSDALKIAGFEVRDHYETTRDELWEVWQDIENAMQDRACTDCVFYFSGHAKNGSNDQYFLPIDYLDLDHLSQYPAFRRLIEILNAHENDDGASVLLLDVGEAPSRSRSMNFLEFDMNAVTVSRTAIIFSFRPDDLAVDDSVEEGPFARAAVDQLRRPGLELSDFYRGMAAQVRADTNGESWPRLLGVLPRPFFLFPQREEEDAFTQSAELRAARVIVPQADGSLVPTYTTSHALLIGASDYRADSTWFDLPGVRVDIDTVGKVLSEKHGFEVETILDPTKQELERALAEFAVNKGADENARLMIYYAGHGYTLGVPPLRTGWIVPVDAPDPAKDPSGFFQSALSMDQISKYSLLIGAKHVLWVFDSCFSGQLIETLRGGESPDKWESFLQTGKVRRVITSGSADQLVPDRSVFASYFVAALEGKLKVGGDGGLVTGNQLSHFLKGKVIEDRGSAQTPQFGTIKLFGADEGDIIFHITSAE